MAQPEVKDNTSLGALSNSMNGNTTGSTCRDASSSSTADITSKGVEDPPAGHNPLDVILNAVRESYDDNSDEDSGSAVDPVEAFDAALKGVHETRASFGEKGQIEAGSLEGVDNVGSLTRRGKNRIDFSSDAVGNGDVHTQDQASSTADDSMGFEGDKVARLVPHAEKSPPTTQESISISSAPHPSVHEGVAQTLSSPSQPLPCNAPLLGKPSLPTVSGSTESCGSAASDDKSRVFKDQCATLLPPLVSRASSALPQSSSASAILDPVRSRMSSDSLPPIGNRSLTAPSILSQEPSSTRDAPPAASSSSSTIDNNNNNGTATNATKRVRPVTGAQSLWLLTEFDRLATMLATMSADPSSSSGSFAREPASGQIPPSVASRSQSTVSVSSVVPSARLSHDNTVTITTVSSSSSTKPPTPVAERMLDEPVPDVRRRSFLMAVEMGAMDESYFPSPARAALGGPSNMSSDAGKGATAIKTQALAPSCTGDLLSEVARPPSPDSVLYTEDDYDLSSSNTVKQASLSSTVPPASSASHSAYHSAQSSSLSHSTSTNAARARHHSGSSSPPTLTSTLYKTRARSSSPVFDYGPSFVSVPVRQPPLTVGETLGQYKGVAPQYSCPPQGLDFLGDRGAGHRKPDVRISMRSMGAEWTEERTREQVWRGMNADQADSEIGLEELDSESVV